MSRTRALRRAAFLSAGAVLAATLAPVAAGPSAPVDTRLVSASQPTNAGKVYRWGLSQWHDGFVEALTDAWAVNLPGQVDDQHGMLTMNGGPDGRSVVVTLTGHGRRYGRWETRVRAEQYGTGRTPYRVVAELVPTRGSRYHCGAQSVVLADYLLGTGRAHTFLRTLPDRQFRYGHRLDLRPGVFHTYAVEVTGTHISWFVDAHVVMTERRAAARTGLRYKLRFRLVGDGAPANPGRMQMDWVRYYTLDRPNAQPIDAPRAHRRTYAGAC